MNEIEPKRNQAENVALRKDGKPRSTRRCSRTMKNGEQCKKAPIYGGTVCSKHGGRAPHIKQAAKRRLEEATALLAKELLGMATSEDLPPAVRLAAIKDALDRGGMSPQQAVQITHEVKPYEQLLQKVHRGPRTRAVVEREDDDIIDAEVVEEGEGGIPSCRGCGKRFPSELPPHLDAYPEFCANCRTEDSTPPRPTRRPRPHSSHAPGVDFSAYESQAEALAEQDRRRAAASPPREATAEPISSAHGTARGHRDPGDGPGRAPSEHDAGNGLMSLEDATAQAAEANRRAGVYGRRQKRRG